MEGGRSLHVRHSSVSFPPRLLGGHERRKTEVSRFVPDPKVGPSKRNCLEGVGNREEQNSD